jgi:SAM-dependent methyltransferase
MTTTDSNRRKILDFGCGDNKAVIEGADVVGIDMFNMQKADVAHDLRKFPYPFKDDTFDEVRASHIMEHLPDTPETMAELWRITKNGGLVKIWSPHFSGVGAYENPTHVRYFSLYSFDLFCNQRWEKYGKARFEVVKRKLRYRIGKNTPLLDRLANAKPYIFERFLSYYVGGFEEIEVWLKVRK